MTMKTTIALFAVLCASLSWVAQAAIACPGASAQCSALAALRISVNGVGSCSGIASANCAAFAAATEPCVKEVEVLIEKEECKEEDIIVAAKCFAAAIASVFAEAYAKVQCTGNGQGCGFALSNAEAWACTFAAVLVDLQVSVGADQAKCEAEIDAMAGVFAAAAAEAQAAACVTGNQFAEDYESEFAIRVETILVQAIASCWVKCDGATASTTSAGAASVSASPFAVGDGDTFGGSFPLPFDPFGGP